MRVDFSLLREALHLPEGTEIVKVYQDCRYRPDVVEIVIRHPDLPPTYENEMILTIDPTFRIVTEIVRYGL
jgi:hypothetical protein